MRWLRRTIAFAAAVLVATALGSLASSHFVMFGIVQLGIYVPWADRLAVYGHDLLGLGPLLAVVVGIAMLVGLPLAALGIRLLPAFPGHRVCGYALAGGLAVLAAFLAMALPLGAMPVAGARTWPGLLAQATAGAFGGIVFAGLAPGYPSASRGSASEASDAGAPASSSSTTS